MRFGGRIPGQLLRDRYVVRLHRGTAHDLAHEKGPTGSVRLNGRERTVPLSKGAKVSQGRGR